MSYKMSKSIRFKFTFAFTLFVAMVLFFFSIVLYTIHARQMRSNMEKTLIFAIEQSSRNFFDENGSFHFHVQDDQDDISQFVVLRIYRGKKLLYCSHNIPLPAKKYPYFGEIQTGHGKFLALTKSITSLSKEYTIQAFYFQTAEEKQLRNLVLILVSLVAICIFCSIIGAWYLSFKLLSPFRQIAENASRISAKNLNEQLQYSMEHDEVGQLCITLNTLFARLQNSFKSLEKFTSNASHELKTPLTIMRGDIEVLLRRKRTPEEYEQTLRCTIKEIDRMYQLIQGLLLLAQAEGEKIVTEATQLSLVQIISSVKNNLQKIYTNTEIAITENIDNDLYVVGNPIWIQQIVENLLNNAFQNTPPQGNILISLEKYNSYAKLTITNYGKGIATKHLPFIFDRFYSVKSNHSTNKGFGLGLAICKAFAEKHGGYIQVTSILSKETIFSLYLPVE